MGKIRVGAAKMCITPSKELFSMVSTKKPKSVHPDGWKVPEESKATTAAVPPMTDVYMDLYTRAVVIEADGKKFLFMNLDVGPSLDDIFKDEIHQRYGIPAENILGVWTHNHSAGKFNKWSRDPNSEVRHKFYLDIVRPAIFGAIDTAIARLQPAKYGFGEGKSYINVNRDELFEDGHWMEGCNFEGPVDRTLAVLKFEDMQGNLIAAVTNYGCHPTSLRPEVPDADGIMKVAPDFPGVSSDFVERRYGGDAVVLWTNGSSGDVNPVCTMGFLRKFELDGYNEPIDTPYGFGYLNMMSLGQRHGIDTYRTIESITEMKDEMEINCVGCILDLPGQRPEEGHDNFLDWAITDNLVRKRCPDLLINDRAPAKETRGQMIPDGISKVHMQLALLGDVAYVGISGEPYCEIGFKMKSESPYKNTVVVSHSHGDAMYNGGYLLSDNAKDHDTFSKYSTHTYPGGNDARISNKMLEMFETLGVKTK